MIDCLCHSLETVAHVNTGNEQQVSVLTAERDFCPLSLRKIYCYIFIAKKSLFTMSKPEAHNERDHMRDKTLRKLCLV